MLRSVGFLLVYLAALPLVFVTPFLGGLLWVWMSLMNPHKQLWIEFLPIGYAQFIVMAMALSTLLSRERKLPPSSAMSWSMGLMIIVTTLALFNSVDWDISYPRWDSIWKGLTVCLLLLPLMNSKLRIQALVWTIAISIGYYGAKGGYFALSTGGTGGRVLGPAGTMIGDNNHLAVALIMMSPLMMYLGMHSARLLIRFGCWSMAMMSIVAAIFTYSRGAAVALAAMLVVLWLRSSQKIWTLIVVAAVAVFVMLFSPQELWDRWNLIINIEGEGSAEGRLRIWGVAIQLWLRNPILGVGFQTTALRWLVDTVDITVINRAVHNSFLEVLAESGAIAFVLHVTMLSSAFIYAQRVRSATFGKPEWRWAYDLASMLQVSLTAYSVGGFFLSMGFYDGWWFVALVSTSLHAFVKKSLVEAQASSAIGRHDLLPAGRFRTG